MQLIDDRGRLWIFGRRINIIDFLALIFVFCLVIPIIFLAPKVLKNEERKRIAQQEIIKKEKEAQEAKDAELAKLQEFLNEHKRARRYFK